MKIADKPETPSDAQVWELLRSLSAACNGYDAETVTNAAVNLLACTAVRSCPTHEAAHSLVSMCSDAAHSAICANWESERGPDDAARLN